MCTGVILFCSCLSPGLAFKFNNFSRKKIEKLILSLSVSTRKVLKLFHTAWILWFSIVCGYFWMISTFLFLWIDFHNGYPIDNTTLLCVGWKVMQFQCLSVFNASGCSLGGDKVMPSTQASIKAHRPPPPRWVDLIIHHSGKLPVLGFKPCLIPGPWGWA